MKFLSGSMLAAAVLSTSYTNPCFQGILDETKALANYSWPPPVVELDDIIGIYLSCISPAFAPNCEQSESKVWTGHVNLCFKSALKVLHPTAANTNFGAFKRLRKNAIRAMKRTKAHKSCLKALFSTNEKRPV